MKESKGIITIVKVSDNELHLPTPRDESRLLTSR